MTARRRDVSRRVAAKLILDELFDLSLYRTLRDLAGSRLRAVLDELIPIDVGVSYFVGALVPVLPVLLGARSLLFPVVTAGSMIVAVSLALAFLSGMDIGRRVAGNVVIMGAAVAITYALGSVAREVWGLSL